ncbi:Biotin carboxyl carrier protein of acetyl-CoA carboxylase [Acidisarcina polymorpha]|uniref:Biotin carboxyl carrier protein of acetyl-CoA carboxylase n=1 Tax=Acidisarcina polymorpha TaxID=2211140 RepID=A0A2Z5G8H2_9BACT|nr:acetyl-CoA carboxylase biotin carboxyl carrier protein [Acidisarcina polymorpha]AXC14856.1 Biotin carboxyl carrier protein of acetyl-CoA carboxylase [Acidisarcina polymorpha]
MNPEELNALKELIAFLKDNQIGEFDLERGDLKVRLKFAQASGGSSGLDLAGLNRLLGSASAAPAVAHPVTPAASAQPPAPADEDADLHIVKSPIVGTFYESPSPGSPPFVKPGDTVEAGQVLCIVEAMKLMNEIESDVAGEIVKRFVQTGQPIEYGQPLFSVRPS